VAAVCQYCSSASRKFIRDHSTRNGSIQQSNCKSDGNWSKQPTSAYHRRYACSRKLSQPLFINILAIINWLSAQLTKQKRNDFKPRNDDLSFARVNTEPCLLCCESLEKVRDAAKQNLSGKNLEVFLTEIGVAFHRRVIVD